MNETLERELARCQKGAVIGAVAGGGLCVVGAIFDRRAFFVSYLFAHLFWMGLSLGCFMLVMIHHLTAGRWGEVTRRFLEAGMAALPVMAILFIPIFFGLRDLYPWARPEQVAVDPELQKRTGYATALGFVVRSAVCLIVWSWMAACLRKWSLQQDFTPDAGPTRKLRRLSGPGVVIYPLMATFAYVDWLLSIEPRWYSTMFPIIVCIGQILCAISFAIMALAWGRRREPWSAMVEPMHLRQLGNLLLAFVLFWTYVSFGQLLIIYSGNLPAEIDWYLHRIAGNWKWILCLIALCHFFIPFYTLLFRVVTRNMTRLAWVAALVFATGIVDAYWAVAPTFFPRGIHIDWLDFAAPICLGGVWMAIFCASLRRQPVLPRNDPRFHHEEVAAHAA
ncbi:MAG TPA: hypothetical protein VGO59_16620 [Verrucomicrobiae bacterium]|jgi:hypothetical protein